MTKYLNRFKTLIIILFSLFVILTVRVFYLTFLNPNEIYNLKNNKVIRGNIYDSRGIELAISKDSSTIGVDPKEIYDISFTANQLEEYIELSKLEIEKQIKNHSSYFLLKRELDNDLANQIEKMSLPGIRIDKEFKRVYPQGNLVSNLIGFTGVDDERALSGLENIYNKELMSVGDTESVKANNLHLTIDGLLQYKLEKVLEKKFIQSKSKKAIGIIKKIDTGEILAMASFPNFNPNEFSKFDEHSRINWAIRNLYEPGSTMKMFIANLLLQERLVSDNERFFCPGYITLGNSTVRCNGKHGSLTISEILQKSCNVGIIKASNRLSNEQLYFYLKKLNFGNRSGVNLDERVGIFPELKNWHPSTKWFMSIGQGFSVSPIQFLAAASSLMNGGYYVEPRVVSHITNSHGEIIYNFPTNKYKVKDNEMIRDKLLNSLIQVVRYGTGKEAFIANYEIAGKTGTGQKAVPGQGYKEGLLSASFLGFFPADKTKYSGLIIFDEPKRESDTGGGLAAPAFREIILEILPILYKDEDGKTYHLETLERKKIDQKIDSLDLIQLSKREVIDILVKNNLKFKLIGDGFCYKFTLDSIEKNNKKERILKVYFK